jgi:hypothetical protein
LKDAGDIRRRKPAETGRRGGPRLEDIRFLEEGLYAFNVEATGISDAKVLSLFLRADDGSPMAGVFGWTWGGTCYIRYLYGPDKPS